MTDRCKNITLATTLLRPVIRLHSSRMSTSRSLTVFRSLLLPGGSGGRCVLLGVVVSSWGGVYFQGVCLLGGVSALEGVCSGGVGVSASGGWVCVSASGRCVCFWGGVCVCVCLLQRGVVCFQGVSAPEGGLCLLPGRGVCVSAPEGSYLLPGGCLLQRGGLLRGVGVCVCSQGGGIPACAEADTPPVNRITDTSKNITLATTSLRPLINQVSHSKNGLQPRYDASIDADVPNVSLTFSVNEPKEEKVPRFQFFFLN